MNNIKILIGILSIIILLISGCIGKPPVGKPPVKECALSECDCKCYPTGDPITNSDEGICSMTCLGGYGITGCELRDGECVEKYITENESMEIAKDFVKNGQTYKFDGSELLYVKSLTLKCPFCWDFIFEFRSGHAGYGNRTGNVLAQVVTKHKISVSVEKGMVVGATIDNKWDELNNKFITEQSRYCEKDSDCVPAQCCHPTSCVNKKSALDCSDILCTAVCMGPMDCGAGRCICENNICVVKSTSPQFEI